MPHLLSPLTLTLTVPAGASYASAEATLAGGARGVVVAYADGEVRFQPHAPRPDLPGGGGHPSPVIGPIGGLTVITAGSPP